MGSFMHSGTPRFWPHEMTTAHTPDPIVDPEPFFEGFENLMPTGHTHRLLHTVIICQIMTLCL